MINSPNFGLDTNVPLDLSSIEASQTTEDVLADISRLEEENEKLEKKEQVLAEAAQSTDPKDLEKLRNQVEATENVWRKRKRQCKDILDTVSEGMDKKPAVVIVRIPSRSARSNSHLTLFFKLGRTWSHHR